MTIHSRRPTLRRGRCKSGPTSSNGGPNATTTSTTAKMKARSTPSPSVTTTRRATVKVKAVFPLCGNKSAKSHLPKSHHTPKADLSNATASAYRPLGLAKEPSPAIPTWRQWTRATALSPLRSVRFGRVRPRIGNLRTSQAVTATMCQTPNRLSGFFGWRTFLPADHHLACFHHAEREVTLASRQQSIPLLLTFTALPHTTWRTPRPISSLPSMATAKLGPSQYGTGSSSLTGRRFF